MDDAVLAALKIPFDSGAISAENALFINAVPGLKATAYQQFDAGKARACNASSDFPQKSFDTVALRSAKNREETLFYIAKALSLLNENGTLVIAAANDAGGKRLVKDIEATGLQQDNISKHKCRIVWAKKQSNLLQQNTLNEWLAKGEEQQILGGKFISRPGIFGWDKIDIGSQILIEHLPDTLAGNGADFGCGYGFLAAHALDHFEKIKKLSCIDIDARAVVACTKNLNKHEDKCTFLWDDITRPTHKLPPLDFILMNPPFHEDKKTTTALGTAFIERAAQSLRSHGWLFLVANAHLPYEQTLQKSFKTVRLLTQAGGFKVYHAVK